MRRIEFVNKISILIAAYMVYQGNPHIYHSQQVPGSYEAFGRLPRSNSYMELYPSSPYAGYPSGGYGGVRGECLKDLIQFHFYSNIVFIYMYLSMKYTHIRMRIL